MEYLELKKKVDEIVDRAAIYETELLDSLQEELTELRKPIQAEMEELEALGPVKRYIELKHQSDYILREKGDLCSYYPK